MYLKDEQTGSYYSIQNGELIQNPMNIDGSMDSSSCSVDFDAIVFEPGDFFIGKKVVSLYEYLQHIKRKLQRKEVKLNDKTRSS